jgi:hypothetical protein
MSKTDAETLEPVEAKMEQLNSLMTELDRRRRNPERQAIIFVPVARDGDCETIGYTVCTGEGSEFYTSKKAAIEAATQDNPPRYLIFAEPANISRG